MQKLKQNMLDNYGYLFCEHCGINQSIMFSVHHIVYRSEAPHHNRLHDLRNLIICCFTCHKAFHANKSLRNDLVKERGLERLFNKKLIRNE